MHSFHRTNILWAAATELAAGHANHNTVHAFYHLFHVRYGQGVFLLQGTPIKLSKGTCILVPPQVGHEIPEVSHSLLGFHEVKFEINDGSLAAELEKTPSVFLSPPFFDPLFDYICRYPAQEFADSSARDLDCFLSAILTWPLTQVHPTLGPRYVSAVSYNDTTQKTLHYIDQNFHDWGSLTDMAGTLGRNPNYLCDNFKKDTGFTITDYLNFIRTFIALQNILFRRYTPLNEVAFLCGFRSVSNFNRVFKRLVGVSPSEFQDRLSQSESAGIAGPLQDLLVTKRYPSVADAMDTLRHLTAMIAGTGDSGDDIR